MSKPKKKTRSRVLRILGLLLIILLILVAVTRISSTKKEKGRTPGKKQSETSAADPAEESPDSAEADPEAQSGDPVQGPDAVDPAVSTEPFQGEPSALQLPEEIAPELPQEDAPLALGWGLKLIGISSYSGMFVEDGSDDSVSDVMGITLRNDGEDSIQLATVTLTSTEGKACSFTLTTLLPGQTMFVLESARASFDPAFTIASASVDNVAVFNEVLSMHEEVLEITAADQSLTVKNVSGADFPGGRIFYKTCREGVYFGGITYMATVPELPVDAEVTLYAGHYLNDLSQLVFVTYG